MRRIWGLFVVFCLSLAVRLAVIQAAEPNLSFGYSCLLETASSNQIVLRATAVDVDGNVYLGGYFWGTQDFDCTSGTDSKSSAGSFDAIFMSKYNADGSYGWTHIVAKDATFSGEAQSIVIGGENVYFGGFFSASGAVDFDDGAGTDNLTSNGLTDGVVIVYSRSGSYQDSYQLGGAGQDQMLEMEIDSSGNILTSGYFEQTVDFDLGAGVSNKTVTYRSSYLAKYNSDFSSLSFAHAITGLSTPTYPTIAGVAVDGSDNILVAGGFQGANIDLDGSSGTDSHSSNASTKDIYISKYSANGTYQWSRSVGGSGFELAYDVAGDSDGNVYAVGYGGSSSIDMDGTGGTDTRDMSNGDGFLTKYTAAGAYVTSLLQQSDSDSSTGQVMVDGNDNVYIAGEFYGNSADVDGTGSGTDYNSLGDYDAFLVRYGQDLSWEWSKRFGGDDSDIPYSNSLDSNGVNALVLGITSASGTSFTIEGESSVSKGSVEIPVILYYSADSSVPTLSLQTIGTTTDTTPSVTGTATDVGGTVATVSFQIDSTSGSWTACSADDGSFDEATEDFSCQVTTPLSSSAHTIYFYVSDSNSNEGVSATSQSFTVSASAVNSTSNSSSNNQDQPAVLTKPGSFPLIYALETTMDSIKMKFVPGVGPISHYYIEYSRQENWFEYAVNPIGDGDSREFRIGSLLPNTSYYLRLTPVNGLAVGPSSFVQKAKTLPLNGQARKVAVESAIPSAIEEALVVIEKLYVKVVTESEEPVEEVEVVVTSTQTEAEELAAVTDEAGVAEFGEIESGEYQLRVEREGEILAETTVYLAAGPSSRVQVTVQDQLVGISEVNNQAVEPRVYLEESLGIPPLVGQLSQQVTGGTLLVGGLAAVTALLFGTIGTIGVLLKGLLPLYQDYGRSILWLGPDILDGILKRLGIFIPWVRRKKAAGIVAEGLTGKPIAAAYVIFYSASGNLSSDFSDRDGRYQVRPAPDVYQVRAEAEGYLFPAKNIGAASSYQRIYKAGEKITVSEEGLVGKKLTILMGALETTIRMKLVYYLQLFMKWLSYLAIPFVLYSVLYAPHELVNQVAFGVIGVSLAWRTVARLTDNRYK